MSGDNRDTGRPLVLIVDDDRQVRESLAELMVSVDLETACFGSTRDLLDAPRTIRPAAPSSASLIGRRRKVLRAGQVDPSPIERPARPRRPHP
jgi:hypothetical protein